jgi:hypothetical protein
MGQVTIYLDSETEEKMNNIVKKKGISKSKWIAALIKEKTGSTWPDHIFDLAGAWKDLPTAEEIRSGMGHDAKREPL